MEVVKRTDKFKKKSFGGFYADYRKWDVRGKSSKQLKEIIIDQRNCITHQLVRIKKIKYVLEIYKAKDVTHKLIAQKKRTAVLSKRKLGVENKLKRRDNNIEQMDAEIGHLELTVKQQEREIVRLSKSLDKKDELIAEVRERVPRIKKVDKPLTPTARRLERLADSGVDSKTLNNLEYLTRTEKFLKERKLTLQQMSVIIKAELLGNVKTSDVGVSYGVLTKLTELEYLQFSNGLVKSMKYWFVSVKGKQLIKDYKN